MSEYCAYSHYAAMLERAGKSWLIAMFEAYFDDSGTDGNSDIAIAACYISTKRGWDDFVRGWDHARVQEDFETFHMSSFMAPRNQREEPFCDWDNTKKTHVYQRLAKIINENKWIGVSVAIPKKIYDGVPERLRRHFGREHYTFAVRQCLVKIGDWRRKSLIKTPMQYVFDFEMRNSAKHKEISVVFDSLSVPVNESLAQWYGIEPYGYSFQHKEKFKPLQAADILAWQMQSHMRKIGDREHNEESLCHPGFKMLRESPEMDLGFMTKENVNKFVERAEQWEKENGSFPLLYK